LSTVFRPPTTTTTSPSLDLISRTGSQRVTVVLPARDEDQTVSGVIAALAPLADAGLVDDLVVIDSLSTDRTAEVAAAAGARVVRADDAWPQEPALRGKGEAMWRPCWPPRATSSSTATPTCSTQGRTTCRDCPARS